MNDGPIIIVSRGVANRARRDDLVSLLRSMTEHEEQERGTLLHALVSERDDPYVIWGLTIYQDVEARSAHFNNVSPLLEKMDGLWEQWPHPVYCAPLAAKVADDL